MSQLHPQGLLATEPTKAHLAPAKGLTLEMQMEVNPFFNQVKVELDDIGRINTKIIHMNNQLQYLLFNIVFMYVCMHTG